LRSIPPLDYFWVSVLGWLVNLLSCVRQIRGFLTRLNAPPLVLVAFEQHGTDRSGH
jgi:hypothetical protein